MKVTQKSKLALVSLVQMTKNSEKQVRVQDLANDQKCSTHFLEQIFRNLRIAKIVKSVRGPGGGYKLARPATEVSVKDVMVALKENLSDWGGDFSDTAEASQVSEYLISVENNIRKEFESQTLAKMAGVSDNVIQFPAQTVRAA